VIFRLASLIHPKNRISPVEKKRRNIMSKKIKGILIVIAALVVAGGTYAFAAANVVPDSAAGYAGSTVSGYTVTNIVYNLNATDPTLVDAITFDIAPTSGSVVAALVKVQTASAGTWTTCSLTAGTAPSMSVTCTYGALSVAEITALNVVASSTTDPA
jgi:hypothetical protein